MGAWRRAEDGESRKEKQSERNSQVNIGGKGDRQKEMSRRDTKMKEKRREESTAAGKAERGRENSIKP